MYRTIDCRFWTDDKIRAFSPGARLLILYLITNPHSHYSGLYYLSVVTMQHEVRLLKQFESSWAELLASKMVRCDDRAEQVWIVKMLEYQARGQKLEKGAANHLHGLNPSPLIPQFLDRYPNVKQFCSSDTLSIAYPYPIDTVPSFPSTSPDPDPSLLTIPILHLKSNGHTDEFEQFWMAYPKKVGKKKALLAWKKAMDKPVLVDIIQAIELAKHTEQWTKDNGQFIPHPSTWLNEGRWADQPVQKAPTTMDAFLSRQPYKKQEGLT